MLSVSLEEIRRLRLAHQHLLEPTLTDPASVVAALGAMQAQEYAMAKWAIALRMRGSSTDMAVEVAFDEGRILRAHLLRPTWHFATREDYRMVLRATAARVHQANAFVYRRIGLDVARLDRFAGLVQDLLADGSYLTREEIRGAVPGELFAGEQFTMAYLLMYAELEGVVCSGPRRGNQFTYALLDQRAGPDTNPMSVEDAQTELVRRYLSARGPATVADLTTWSGLTVAQARQAIAALDAEVTTIEADGQAYLMLGELDVPAYRPTAFLMPDYDEYGMGYKDRSAIGSPEQPFPVPPWNRVMIVDGVIAGGWKRTLAPNSVMIKLDMLGIPAEDPRVVAAAETYASFLGRELVLERVVP